jgi:cytochrome c biogenesis protein CcmG/thiol:disulfide interchange protein DsbE
MKAAIIGLALVLFGLTTFADTTAVDQRPLAPNFTLETIRGKQITLSSYRGRVVLLDFWATWCGGCKIEIPWFVEFDKKYQREGLATVGIAMDEEGQRVVLPYVTEHRIPYSIASGYPMLMKPYAITALPVTLLIDKEGRIADIHKDIVDKNEWEREIQELLREPYDMRR